MSSRKKSNIFVVISLAVWFVTMSLIYYTHYIDNADQELGYFSSDITFDTETRQYFSIDKDNQKIGYKSVAQIYPGNSIIYYEESVIKMNLAGKSREVFIQCSVGIDSARFVSNYMEFRLQSGSHHYNCTGTVKGDSLIIEVRTDVLAPVRKGLFIVDKNITFSITLPFFIHRSATETMSIEVFDPIIFDHYIVHIVRRGKELLLIDNQNYEVVRYDLSFLNKQSSLWLDENGKVVKSEGYLFFSGELGKITIQKAMNKNVFLLPLEVALGNDIIKQTVIYPDRSIPDPRNTTYLELQLDGIRAANIDVTAPNKEILSFNPLIIGIHNKSITEEQKLLNELITVAKDTSLVGISDYVQSKDARIFRAAQTIISTQSDTLSMARAINRWVYENVKKEKELNITRSIDILRIKRGDSEEHTKLFTALARSIGIITQINAGLIYIDGAFRYHSWPSVFVEGTWYDMDPTLGQDAADATHISLVRGGYDRLVELLRMIGKISIKVIDYR